jgi:AcrR family transcriptional regulator
MSEPATTEAPTRRDRVRAATTEEIKQTARRILVERGPEAVSLRAIAREMGMTAPGLYRYFDSREGLIRAVVADIFNQLTADVTRAIQAAAREHDDDLTKKLVASCREFRNWALLHQGEFALIFGSPLPGLKDDPIDVADECGRQFAGVYFALFRELWARNPFPVAAPDEIDPGLRDQIERFGALIRSDLPVGATLRFLRCWTKMYGAVSMEVFGHLGFALEDPAPMFDLTLAELAADLGLEYHAGKN